ncbi:HTH domain-containing protein [Clostridium amylolyticum]|uniref:HTH domain-containing protein n=1 Tax=Clostridium amylolyticum TaxID=1121298 RepID=A0A1M6J7A3_9CLOT|nr:HTH domain-containing protein [Clostridium amylolyticum]SHJ42540.1 HTH domain-containing protein [Clostridium amylolyticum]
MDAKELVLETLKKSNEPMKAGEIAEATNIDKKEVDKALKALKTEEKINSPKRCYYSAN